MGGETNVHSTGVVAGSSCVKCRCDSTGDQDTHTRYSTQQHQQKNSRTCSSPAMLFLIANRNAKSAMICLTIIVFQFLTHVSCAPHGQIVIGSPAEHGSKLLSSSIVQQRNTSNQNTQEASVSPSAHSRSPDSASTSPDSLSAAAPPPGAPTHRAIRSTQQTFDEKIAQIISDRSKNRGNQRDGGRRGQQHGSSVGGSVVIGENNMRYLTLQDVPHRIYLTSEDLLETFYKKDSWVQNSVERKFVYKLTEPTPCQEFKATFGCCWDNITIAVGPRSKGCPACVDQKRSCRKWKDMCHSVDVRRVCPDTCDSCPKPPEDCLDDPDQKHHCPLFKRFGLCNREQIKPVCRNTCGFC